MQSDECKRPARHSTLFGGREPLLGVPARRSPPRALGEWAAYHGVGPQSITRARITGEEKGQSDLGLATAGAQRTATHDIRGEAAAALGITADEVAHTHGFVRLLSGGRAAII
jgi:hypothetical protein